MKHTTLQEQTIPNKIKKLVKDRDHIRGSFFKPSTYKKVSMYEGRKGEVRKVVLLYSGGLDTSVMTKWIQEEYDAEVIALTIDIGQQTDNLEEIRKKALKLGALKAIVIDAKDDFAENYIAQGIKANASYQGRYYLSTPLGRPLLTKLAVKVAAREGADCIAHGCTGKGNDQVRIEGTALALNPDIKIIAPVREWAMGRDEEMSYALKHRIPVTQTYKKLYSYDDNMWGVTGEGGEIENPELVPPLENILMLCTIPEKGPNTPEEMEIEFVKGIPVGLNGKHMKLSEIIKQANAIGAKHGIGVSHHIEDRVVGIKVRGVYEAPAAELIITAHRNLEKYVSTRNENEFKSIVDTKWAYTCYGGLWLEPLMNDLNAYIDKVNEKVTGTVRLKMCKGLVEPISVKTPNTIFKEKLATFLASSTFNQNASPGFIELHTLQMRLAQQAEKTVLLSIGKEKNRRQLLPEIRMFHELGYHIYATEHTHEYLKKLKIPAILVHKISNPNRTPNLFQLLQQNRFDLIINITNGNGVVDKKKQTDGQIIKEFAIKNKTHLITDIEVVSNFVNKLYHVAK